jgi:periplasmic glucans biosynthesis protein
LAASRRVAISDSTWIDRRSFVAGSAAAFPVFASIGGGTSAAAQPARDASGDAQNFDAQTVRNQARQLAQAAYKEPDKTLPKELADLSYDAHRAIRFKPELALWRTEGLPFQVQFFHRGFIFNDRVDVFEVAGGRARPITYSPSLFDFGPNKPPAENSPVGFAGFRLHTPFNRGDYFDEVTVFLGASYFRAVAKGQVYGLSARGLSIATADTKGEEFPAFRAFWIEKPAKGASSIVVHALLDSKSAAGAFRFTIRPGETTVHDVEMALYPRADITQAGIGSLTSMFFFDANDRAGVDDFRPAVHDSDGLAIRNGQGEKIWRPLANPRDLQVSVFGDANPRGFGLMQREREFRAYEDLESRFEKRPGVWVEPIGDWGEGAVQLVEIPTKLEIHDNIVAFWRPREPLRAKSEYTYTYRLHWGTGEVEPQPLAKFMKTRSGAGPEGSRRFVLDAIGTPITGTDPATLRAAVSADKGEIRNLVVQANPVTGGARVSFELVTAKEPVIEMRAQLLRAEDPVSEVWIYRWAP